MYTIAHLLSILNGKHLMRSSWVINPKHHTFMSLAVKLMCFSLVKFMLINLYHVLNWWYLLDMRTIVINLYAIYKEISFSTPHMLSLTRNSFLKYTDSYAKKHKLYNKLLDKISLETELLASDSSEEGGPTPQYPFLPFKTIPLLILLHLFFFISLHFSHLLQSLKNP